MNERVAQLIDQLRLQPHPEGGFYAQTFKSQENVRTSDERSQRSALTAIYFLLAEGQVSRWHRVTSDESWVHLEGAEVSLRTFDGERTEHTSLGPLGSGAVPFAIVSAGHWQAAEVHGAYALVACFVAPGFEFDDFSMMANSAEATDALRVVEPELLRLV